MKVSAPGNMLILGEYAVLEEGGLGAAAAVDAWVHLDQVPDSGLTIQAVMPAGSFTWTRDRPDAGPLISAIVEAVEARTGMKCDARRIHIDSSALFGEGGRKAGFGSSAAVSATLCAALEAHRSAQGGTGSGYDVYASVKTNVVEPEDFNSLNLAAGTRRRATPGYSPGVSGFLSELNFHPVE